MSLLITDATVIDGVADRPREHCSIWVEGARIRALGRRDELGVPEGTPTLDARGKYVIPGLMNANVHLLCDVSLENLVRYETRYEDLIVEAAQVALRNGLTTVFDTWGPRRSLMRVRDRIEAGELIGSRIFCAGNIIGFDGPLSADFWPKAAEVASPALAERINALWVENVGRHLMWLTPSQVADEVRAYIARGIDFIKYGSNDHYPAGAGAFLCFSQQAQAAIVDEAHRAGITAQAHSMSVEGLRTAIEAGCDLVTHCNITGPTPIPETTLELFLARRTGAVIFPWTARALDWIKRNVSDMEWTMWHASDANARALIECGASLLLANDGNILAPETLTDPVWSKWIALGEDNLNDLGQGHFAWLRAMEEKGCPPMTLLRAATSNIARAYGKDKDLGTLESGKIADLLILDRNPLESADHYRRIHQVVKNGVPVDREGLPLVPLLTRPAPPRIEEQDRYVPFLKGGMRFPYCPMCR